MRCLFFFFSFFQESNSLWTCPWQKITFIQHHLFFYFMLKWILLGDEEAGHAAANRLVFFFFFFGKVVSVTNGIFKSLFFQHPKHSKACSCSVSLLLYVQVLKAASLLCFYTHTYTLARKSVSRDSKVSVVSYWTIWIYHTLKAVCSVSRGTKCKPVYIFDSVMLGENALLKNKWYFRYVYATHFCRLVLRSWY